MAEGSRRPAPLVGRSEILKVDDAEAGGRGNKENLCGVSDFLMNTGPRSKRNKKGALDCTLRKSIAWNQAFFTEEGVLNPLELSLLSGNTSLPNSGCVSPLTEFSKFSNRSPLHDLGRNSVRKMAVSGSFCKPEASSHEDMHLQAHTPSGNIMSGKGRVPRGVPRSPATHSQKRVSSINTSDSASKIPKCIPKSNSSSIPISSRNTMLTTKSSKSNQNDATVNVERTVSRVSSDTKNIFLYSTDDPGRSKIPKVEKNFTCLKAVKGSSSLSKLHEPAISAASSKVSTSSVQNIRNISVLPPAAAHAKPSALRMPSPSLGYFCQGKTFPSNDKQSQKNTQSCQSSIPPFGKPINLKNTGDRTKGFSVKANMKVNQQDVMDRRDSINSGNCQFTTNGQAQLKSNQLAVVGTIDDPHRNKETVYEDTYKFTRDSSGSEVSSQTCLRKNDLESGLKQRQEDTSTLNNLEKHLHIGNTGQGSYSVPYCPPDTGSGFTAEKVESAASTEIGSSFKLRNEQLSGASIDNILEPDQPLTQKTCITTETTLDYHAKETISAQAEHSDLQTCSLHYGQYSNVTLAIEKDVLMSEKKQLEGKPKPDVLVLKNQLNALPFSDEWVASLEAIGEDVLKLKSGPVQNSPTDKALPEPGPWSPVKRKAQDIGPYDCTKYSKNPYFLEEMQ